MMISFSYPLVLILFPLIAFFLVHIYLRNKGRKQLWALALRLLITAMLLTALAGINISIGQSGRDVLFLLDVSESISAQEKKRSMELLRTWVKRMDVKDRAGIIVFAKEALIERPLSPDSSKADLRSLPEPSETDIAKALALSIGLVGVSGSPRLVLLTDGHPTRGETITAALDLARSGIPLYIFPLGERDEAETYLASLRVPERVRAGAPFFAEIFIKSRTDTMSKVQWFVQGALKKEKEVFVPKERGVMVKFNDSIETTGQYESEVKILPEKDTRVDNNQLSGHLFVTSQPEILYLSSERADSMLARVLSAQPFSVTRGDLREGVPNLNRFDLILMENLSVSDIGQAFQEQIRESVITQGMGFFFLGSFGDFPAKEAIKEPLMEILPVTPGSPEKRQKQSLALVILLDKSGSMETENKIAYARKAATSAILNLDDGDQIGLIAFDAEAIPVLPMTRKSDLSGLEERLDRLRPSGGTRLTPAFSMASRWLQEITAGQKLMLILSDGKFLKEDSKILELGPLPQVRISTVGIEPEADREFLQELSGRNGGKSYFGRVGEEIPRFFIQEVTRMSRQMTLPEAVKPKIRDRHTILTGIAEDSIPAIEGYLMAEPKKNSTLLLEVGEGDPLLAVWQFGYGRSGVLTTDLTRWGKDWLGWKDFPKLLTQLMRWLMGQISEVLDEAARFESEKSALKEGISPELSKFGPDLDLLQKIANLTGGKIINEDENPFDRKASTGKEKVDPTSYLLLAAFILYLVELILHSVYGPRFAVPLLKKGTNSN